MTVTSIITGSNAHLLSTELSTYLSGQYVEIKVLPLSFREFLDFHGYTITDSLLLRNLMMFLADNIGNSVSATSIGNTLVSEGLLTEGNRKVKPATHTIQAYFEALKDSYISYEIKRFDIKGKESPENPRQVLCRGYGTAELSAAPTGISLCCRHSHRVKKF